MNAPTPTTRRSRAEGLLLLSAGALLACAAWAWLSGPLSALRGTPSIADVALAGTDHGLLTSDGGGDDILVVLDQRNEELLLYRPMNGRTIDFRGRFPLRQLFADARANTGLVPMPEPERQPGTPTVPASPPDNPAR
ncbi:MAG: hypothetical protein Q8L55_00195 [Phycisphaerales bacterium]|nr:hypothetical protein [Phycisphaerales bacterium]